MRYIFYGAGAIGGALGISLAGAGDDVELIARGAQLAATLDKHFSGVNGLVLAAVDLSRLADAVRWEPSRSGQLFPHIHGVLTMDAVVCVVPLERTPDGTVKLPALDATVPGQRLIE